MATIEAGRDIFTILVIFEVTPDQHADLFPRIQTFVGGVLRYKPGFISANFHTSADGEHVFNYSQWTSEEAWLAALTPDVITQAAFLREYPNTVHVLDVAFTIDAPSAQDTA